MKKLYQLALSALLLGAAGTLGVAQIKAFTLEEMINEADDAVYGEIVNSRVFRVDDPVDGPELYFTTLTISGKSLSTETATTVDVTYHGGFIDAENGVWNSEAPSADDVKLGNQVVVFYKWTDDMGGGVAANQLMAAHGGIYRTVDGGQTAIALGRGNGYAIDKNLAVQDLESAIQRIRIPKNR